MERRPLALTARNPLVEQIRRCVEVSRASKTFDA
jgi:hypothetical protein